MKSWKKVKESKEYKKEVIDYTNVLQSELGISSEEHIKLVRLVLERMYRNGYLKAKF